MKHFTWMALLAALLCALLAGAELCGFGAALLAAVGALLCAGLAALGALCTVPFACTGRLTPSAALCSSSPVQ